MIQKFRLTNLGLFGVLLLLLVAFICAIYLNNLQQNELAKADSLRNAFESHQNVDKELTFLDALSSAFNAGWQISLRSIENENGSGIVPSGETSIPNTDLKIHTSTLPAITIGPSEIYIDALAGKDRIFPVNIQVGDGQNFTRGYSFPIYDANGNIIGVAETFWDNHPQLVIFRNQLLISLAVFIAILLVGAMSTSRIFEKEFAPITRLAEYANRLSHGETNLQISSAGAGAQALLATELNQIAVNMRKLNENLDELVEERTSDLEKRNRQIQTVAEIASQIAAPHHFDDLLNTTIKLIRENFDYYHTGIFLIDDQKQYAVLKAANGETGKLLVQSGHKLRVGQSGIVGMVTGKGEPRIAADVTQDPAHYRNPILPYTRAEMALPLKASGEVIGAIDVQSTEVGAFSQEDITLLQTLADQLAVAIENTRLVEKLEASIEEAKRLEKSDVEDTWRHYSEQTQITGYQYDQMRILPNETKLPVDVKRQLKAGKVIVHHAEERSLPGGGQTKISTLFVPLSLRDQLIGVIGIEQEQPDHVWSETELAVAQAAANQVSLTLENARLLDETRSRAERERIAGQISSRIRMSNDPNQILQTAVSELKQALRAKTAQVLIAPGAPDSNNTSQPAGDHKLSSNSGGNGHGS